MSPQIRPELRPEWWQDRVVVSGRLRGLVLEAHAHNEDGRRVVRLRVLLEDTGLVTSWPAASCERLDEEPQLPRRGA